MALKNYYFPRTHYADRSPTVNDDDTRGFLVGGVFVKVGTPNIKYWCIDNSTGAAIWFRVPNYIDPRESTSPDIQDDIDTADSEESLFMTPHIMFQSGTIEYDVTINRNAMSVGPITIAEGYTITVETDGSWVVI